MYVTYLIFLGSRWARDSGPHFERGDYGGVGLLSTSFLWRGCKASDPWASASPLHALRCSEGPAAGLIEIDDGRRVLGTEAAPLSAGELPWLVDVVSRHTGPDDASRTYAGGSEPVNDNFLGGHTYLH